MDYLGCIDKFKAWIIDITLPVAACYQLVCANVFLNTAAENATGLEKVGDMALIPFQYAFAGRAALLAPAGSPFKYELKQRFDYEAYFPLKLTGSIVLLPFSVAVGSIVKGLSYLSPEASKHYREIKASIASTAVISNNAYYQSLGIDLGGGNPPEKIASLGYARHIIPDEALIEEKAVLKEIVEILNKNQIPYWADCGTCLGIYRYGGSIPWDNDIDLSILQPDFNNVQHALNALDPSKYTVQDWSNRSMPQSYLRIYVKAKRQFIDIYNYAIHPEFKTIQFILSNESSIFLPQDWKIRSIPFQAETPYSEVFPLKLGDFDGLEICVPNQIKKFLQTRYGENLEPSKIYNEKTGEYEKDPSHPYWSTP